MPEMTAPTVRMVTSGATSGTIHAPHGSYQVQGDLIRIHPEDVETFEGLGWTRADPLPHAAPTDEEREAMRLQAQRKQFIRLENPGLQTRLAFTPGSKRAFFCQGREYVMPEEDFLDVPSEDAPFLTANTGWLAWGPVGPTEWRPAQPQVKTVYFDLTLGLVVLFDGTDWRNPLTGEIL